jgi:hypothetical protein
MPKSKRRWNEDEIAKLKALAGKEPGERIAVELGRTLEARRAVAVSTQRRPFRARIALALYLPDFCHHPIAF